MPNGELCGKDHLERSLEAFSDVIAGRMGGFNYRTCNGTYNVGRTIGGVGSEGCPLNPGTTIHKYGPGPGDLVSG